MNEDITNELKPLLGNVIEGIDASELEHLDQKLKEEGVQDEDDDEESDSDEDEEDIPEWTKREIFVTSLSFIVGELYYLWKIHISLGLWHFYLISWHILHPSAFLSIGNILFTPFEFLLSINPKIFNAFNLLGIFIPMYSAYQEQKVTEAKGKKNNFDVCRQTNWVTNRLTWYGCYS